MTHRIALADFSEGRILCEAPCSALIEVPLEPEFDRNERLGDAWLDHRRSVGAPVPSVSATIGKRMGGKYAMGQRGSL